MKLGRWILPILVFVAMPAVAGTWRVAETPHFEVYAYSDERGLKRVATKLEQLNQLLRLLVPHNEPMSPVKVRLLLTDRRTVSTLFSDSSGSHVWAFYTASVMGPFIVASYGNYYGWSTITQNILFHEYAHHFMFETSRAGYPNWYSEGFADYISATKFRDNGEIDVGNVVEFRLDSLRQQRWLPMEKLMTDKFDDMDAREVAVAYAQGWLLVHYIFEDQDRIRKFDAYIRNLNRGEKPRDALRSAFGMGFEDLGGALKAYFRGGRIHYLRITGLELKQPRITISTLSPDEGKLLKYDFWTEILEPGKDVPARMVKDVRHATRGDDSALAETVRARAEYLAGNLKKAMKLTDRVMHQRANDRDAEVLKAQIVLAEAAKLPGKSETAQKLRDVRHDLVRANHANPNDPVPLFLYYKSFAFDPSGPSKAAKAGLLRARELLPWSDEIAFAAAKLLLSQKRYGQAEQILAPIAHSPHGSQTAAAQKLIDQIETAKSANLKAHATASP